jgi:2-keto-4-pentenoate hydratase/2-oxohepta-3-ene-1,7-dioic acid hydratase in catechol pathway
MSVHSVRNIHAVGRNYAKHIEELGNAVPEEPVLFAKSASCLTSAQHLAFPADLGSIHFELELVLQVGRAVPLGAFRDLDCIARMGLGIDFTARDLQAKLKAKGLPWHRAKSFQDACWLGPLSDQFDLQQSFQFELHQNGERRQIGDSTHMLNGFADLVAFINRGLPLEPGDLIFTGTPEGVGPVAEGDQLRVICARLATDREIRVGFVG